MSVIDDRRKARQAVDQAENVLIAADERMGHGTPAGRRRPEMTAPPEAVAAQPDRAVTLDVLWVAEAITEARQFGWRTCIEVWQGLIDYVNQHPAGHRHALDEVVTDDRLRKILYDALEAL